MEQEEAEKAEEERERMEREIRILEAEGTSFTPRFLILH